MKKINDLLAGDFLLTEQYAGGDFFSPDDIKLPLETEGTFSKTSLLLNGEILKYLNLYIPSSNTLLDTLDFIDFSKRAIEFSKIQISYSYEESKKNIFISNSKDLDIESLNNFENNNIDIKRLKQMIKLGIDLRSFSLFKGVRVAISVNDKESTLEASTLEDFLAGSLLKTGENALSEGLSMSISSLLGISSAFVNIGIFSAVSSLIEELKELALGTDIHFGFGGDYAYTNAKGEAQFERPLSFFEGVKKIFGIDKKELDFYVKKDGSVGDSYYNDVQVSNTGIGGYINAEMNHISTQTSTISYLLDPMMSVGIGSIGNNDIKPSSLLNSYNIMVKGGDLNDYGRWHSDMTEKEWKDAGKNNWDSIKDALGIKDKNDNDDSNDDDDDASGNVGKSGQEGDDPNDEDT